MDAASERASLRDRPALPLTVPLALALAVWGVTLWRDAPAEPQPDSLALELRRFRTLTDERERLASIERFGKVQDPRVALALMEAVQAELGKRRSTTSEPSPMLVLASSTLVYHHIPHEEWGTTKYWHLASLWWERHEDEVRRRAAALPQ